MSFARQDVRDLQCTYKSVDDQVIIMEIAYPEYSDKVSCAVVAVVEKQCC